MGGKTPGPGSAAFAAAEIADRTARQTRPMRQQLFRQLAEVLATGTMPSQRIPEVQRAVEQAALQSAEATRQAEEQAYRAGIGRSTFGIGAVEQARSAAQQAVAGVPTQLATQTLSGAGDITNVAQNLVASHLGIQQQSQAASAQAAAQAQAATTQAAASAAASIITIAVAV